MTPQMISALGQAVSKTTTGREWRAIMIYSWAMALKCSFVGSFLRLILPPA